MLNQQVRNFLGFWGFKGDDIFRPVASFSGGEKARLVLALIAKEKPSLLVLDEPTNHLDLEMRDALSTALNQYEGAVLLVAHDQHLLRQCANEFWLVRDGTVSHFAGDLDDYEALVARAVQVERDEKRENNRSRRTLRQQRARERESRRDSDKRKRELEDGIQATQKQLNELVALLSDTDALNAVDNRELQKTFQKHGRLKKQLEQMEDEWLELEEEA